jgi:hypothetical protein
MAVFATTSIAALVRGMMARQPQGVIVFPAFHQLSIIENVSFSL